MVGWAEMPRSPGHVFYDRLQSVLIEGGFDGFAEAACRAARLGAVRCRRGGMHLVGYFEGIDSARAGMAARIPCRYGSFYGWKAGIVCRTIPAVTDPRAPAP